MEGLSAGGFKNRSKEKAKSLLNPLSFSEDEFYSMAHELNTNSITFHNAVNGL